MKLSIILACRVWSGSSIDFASEPLPAPSGRYAYDVGTTRRYDLRCCRQRTSALCGKCRIAYWPSIDDGNARQGFAGNSTSKSAGRDLATVDIADDKITDHGCRLRTRAVDSRRFIRSTLQFAASFARRDGCTTRMRSMTARDIASSCLRCADSTPQHRPDRNSCTQIDAATSARRRRTSASAEVINGTHDSTPEDIGDAGRRTATRVGMVRQTFGFCRFPEAARFGPSADAGGYCTVPECGSHDVGNFDTTWRASSQGSGHTADWHGALQWLPRIVMMRPRHRLRFVLVDAAIRLPSPSRASLRCRSGRCFKTHRSGQRTGARGAERERSPPPPKIISRTRSSAIRRASLRMDLIARQRETIS